MLGTLASLAPVISHADVMPLPTTSNAVNNVYAYRHALTANDQLYVVDFFTGHSSPLPSYSATQSYIVKLFTSAGVLLGSATPYAYFNNGYQRNIAMIYFATGSTPTWNDGETVSLVGNPGLTWAGAIPSISSPVSYWSSSTSVSFTHTELSSSVIAWAGSLQQAWYPTVTMLQSTALGQRLSTSGQTFFTAVMPTIQQMAPNAFASVISSPTLNKRTASTAQTIANGSGTLSGTSPQTLHSGATLVTATAGGTFTIQLATGQTAVVTSGTAVIAGSPVTLAALTNTVTAGGAGNFTVNTSGESFVESALFAPVGTIWDYTGSANVIGIPVTWFGVLMAFLGVLVLDFFIVKGMGKARIAVGAGAGGYGIDGGGGYQEVRTGGTGTMKGILMVDVLIFDILGVAGFFVLTVDIFLAIISGAFVLYIFLFQKSSG